MATRFAVEGAGEARRLVLNAHEGKRIARQGHGHLGHAPTDGPELGFGEGAFAPG